MEYDYYPTHPLISMAFDVDWVGCPDTRCNTPKFIPSNKGDFNIKDKEDLKFY